MAAIVPTIAFEIRRDREQASRNREQCQAEQNAEPAIYAWAEEADDETSDGHAEGTGIDRKAHCGRRDAIVAR